MSSENSFYLEDARTSPAPLVQQRDDNAVRPSPVNVDGLSEQRSFGQRTFVNMTIHGIRHSFLTLVGTALGGALLAVSYVMAEAGIGLGTMMLLAAAMVSYFSGVALMRIATAIGEATYAGLFSFCAGARAGPILSAVMFIYGNGTCVIKFCFLGDVLPQLVQLVAPYAPAWCMSRAVTILAAFVVILPMALQKQLSAIRHITPVSIISLMYVALMIAARCWYYHSEHAEATNHAEYGEVKVFNISVRVFNAFAICIHALNCHINIVPVAGRLVRPTKERIRKVASRVNVFQVFFYILLGWAGYYSFLAKTPGNILEAFEIDDPYMAVGRLLLSCTMIIAVALNMHPSVHCGLQVRDYFFPNSPVLQRSPSFPRRLTEETKAPPSPKSLPSNPNQTASWSPASPTTSVGGGSLPEGDAPALPRICLTISCLVIDAFIAIKVPDIAAIIGLLGGTVSTVMMMVIPAYAIGKALPYSFGNRCQQALLLCFACITFFAVPVSILQMLALIDS